MNRRANINRKTAETQIELGLELDGTGRSTICTRVGFFDHMLDLLARHGLFDLSVQACGDVDVDFHHTVEDVGIVLGQAIAAALDDKSGICRFGDATIAMDETLATCAVDLSGRPFLAWRVAFPTEKIGAFDTQLVEEFFRAVATNARMNLHVLVHYGQNSHHIAEAIFKAFARALRPAVSIDPRVQGIPSTKGTL